MKAPKVNIENDTWNRENGLRITVWTGHDGLTTGSMYSVENARILAKKLNNACDRVENEQPARLSLTTKMFNFFN